jgi:predicted dehydrogenase
MKVAVVGCGRMGERHIEVAQQWELVGICDRSQDALKGVQERLQLSDAVLFEDYEQMLATAKPDCVIVATTAPSHCGLTCMAAEQGVKFILCEKPMATSIADCKTMIAACEKNGAKLAVNHQMRYMDQFTVPKNHLDSAGFGGLTSIAMTAGNYGISMNGTHYFEMFRFMTGNEFGSVQAWFSDHVLANPRGKEFEDKAGSVRVISKDNKRFYMDIGADQGHGCNIVYAAQYGQVVVDELSAKVNGYYRQEEYRDYPSTRTAMPYHVVDEQLPPLDLLKVTTELLQDLFTDGDYPSGEEAMHAVKVAVAAHISAENDGKVVTQPDLVTHENTRFKWA